MRKPSLVAALALTLLAGCGGGDDDGDSNNAERFDGDDKTIAELVDQFAEAGYDGDGDKICSEIFATPLSKNVERESGQPCAAEVEENLPKGEYELELGEVSVKGATATASVTDQDDNRSVLHFVKSGDDWRILRVTPGVAE